MLTLRAFALAALLASAPAYAAEKQWTAAPVPATGLGGAVAPAERAGRSSGPDNASPFSNIPSGAAASGGQTSSSSTAGPDVGTPSVSR